MVYKRTPQEKKELKAQRKAQARAELLARFPTTTCVDCFATIPKEEWICAGCWWEQYNDPNRRPMFTGDFDL